MNFLMKTKRELSLSSKAGESDKSEALHRYLVGQDWLAEGCRPPHYTSSEESLAPLHYCQPDRRLGARDMCLLTLSFFVMRVRFGSMGTFKQASNCDYRSVTTWILDEWPLANEKEESFMKGRDDIITLRHEREWNSFHSIVEMWIGKLRCCPVQ